MKRISLLFLMALLTILSIKAQTTIAPNAQGIVFVNNSVVGGNNSGNSWANATKELADALKEAKNSSSGIFQIWVAAGTYKPLYTPPGATTVKSTAIGAADTPAIGNRDKTFILAKNVKVYGGFLGIEGETVDNRDWKANATILSGDLADNDSFNAQGLPSNRSDNVYHVILGINSVGTACLDGFTIKGGYSYNDNSSSIKYENIQIDRIDGAGIYNYKASPTLSNLIVIDNSSGGYGAGIANYDSSNPTINNIEIIENNVFDYGGGIFNYASSPILTDVIIKDNTSGYGGGMYNDYESSPILTNVIIENNHAIYDYGGVYNIDANSTYTNVKISGNEADYSGGICNIGGSITLINSEVTNNIATTDLGGISNIESNVNIINSTIAGNISPVNPGLYIDNPGSNVVNIKNSIIYGNKTSGSYIPSQNKSSAINILSELRARKNNESISLQRTKSKFSLSRKTRKASGSLDISNEENSKMPNIYYSIVGGSYNNDTWNSQVGTNKGGNLDADPKFVDPNDGVYKIKAGSPAVDKARNSDYLSTYPNKDLSGKNRIVNTTIDMGAYELQLEDIPNISVDKTSLAFNALVGETNKQSFVLSGTKLQSDINITISPDNAPFSVSPNIITKEDATNKTVEVSFNAIFGEYNATLTISSEGLEDITIALSAEGRLDEFDNEISAISCDSFTFAWEEIAGVDNYTLILTSEEGTTNHNLNTNNNPATIEGLSENTEYQVSIKIDGNNKTSTFDVDTVETPYCPSLSVSPTTVEDIEVRVDKQGSKNLNISGKGLKENISISISGNEEFNLSANQIEVSDGGLFNENLTITFTPEHVGEYSAIVSISSSLGTIKRNIKGIATPIPAPSINPASDVSCSGFTANWQEVDDVDSYTLSLMKDRNIIENIENIETNSYVLSDLDENSSYSYKVKAVSGNHTSEFSNSSNIITPYCPAWEITPETIETMDIRVDKTAQSDIRVKGKGLSGNISISISGDDEFSIDMESIKIGKDGTFDETIQLTFNPSADGEYSAIISFTSSLGTVTRNITGIARPLSTPVTLAASNISCNGFTANWELMDEADSYTLTLTSPNGNETISNLSDNYYSFSYLNENTSYSYFITAIFNGIVSEESNRTTVQTSYCPEWNVSPETLENMEVRIGLQNKQTINVSGKGLTDNITISINGDKEFSVSKSSIPSNKGGLFDETFELVFSPDETGTYSATVTITSSLGTKTINATGTALALPVPTALDASSITCDGFTANWQKLNDADSYILTLMKDSETVKTINNINATSYRLSELEENTSYSYYLKAVFDDLVSEQSNTINSKTSYCPSLTITPQAIDNMNIRADEQDSVEITLSGKGLTETINISISGNSEFTLSKNSISTNEGNLFEDSFSVLFNPSEAGNYSATISITSSLGTETRTISATVTPIPVPAIESDKDDLSFSIYAGESTNDIFTLSGKDLTQNVSLSLTGVGFSIDKTSLTPEELMQSEGSIITVSFSSSTPGEHTAILTISSDEIDEDIEIYLEAWVDLASPTITLEDTTHISFTIDWEDVTGATGYNVYLGDDKLASNISATRYTFTYLSSNTTYQYAIEATADDIVSQKATGSVTTKYPPHGIDDINSSINVYANGACIHVKSSELIHDISVYNIQGIPVFIGENLNTHEYSIENISGNSKLYIVKLRTENKAINKKVMLK